MKFYKILILQALFLILPAFASSGEIENLTQYFEYLPDAVHKNWVPYKSNSDYEVLVQFRINKDGAITEPFIVNSTNIKANNSVLDAVRKGAPYRPLPKSFPGDSVNTQVQLQYKGVK